MASRTGGETKALLIYHNHRAVLEELSDNARGKLMMALLDYSETGALPAFTGPLRMAFVVLREDVDRSSRRWEEECRRRSEAGKKSAALRAAKNYDQNVSCERDFSPEEAEERETAACSAASDAAGARAAVLSGAEEQAAECCGVAQCSTAFNGVEQCSTEFNGVEQCSTAFNGVEARSAVSTNKNQNQYQNKNKNVKENTLARSAGAAGVRAGEFEQFWSAYPRKVGKLAARRAFERADATLEQMLEALARQRADPLWSRENGRYIPYPAAWLEQGRWADEPAEVERGYLRHGAPLGPEMQALVLRSIARMDEKEQLTTDS